MATLYCGASIIHRLLAWCSRSHCNARGMAVCALAAGFFLSNFGGVAYAQSETDCGTLPAVTTHADGSETIWSACLTVSDDANSAPLGGSGYHFSNGGALVPNSFAYDGVTASIAHLMNTRTTECSGSGNNALEIFDEHAKWADLDPNYNRLVLHVGADTRAFSAAQKQSGGIMRWCGLASWSDGDHVTVRLERLNEPSAPTSLGATANSATQVTLSWNAPLMDGGSDITGYEYQQSTDGGTTFGSWTAIANSASLTSYAVTGLTANTDYVFKLRAVNAVGGGTESGTATATTPSACGTLPAVTTHADGSETIWSACLTVSDDANNGPLGGAGYHQDNGGALVPRQFTFGGTTVKISSLFNTRTSDCSGTGNNALQTIDAQAKWGDLDPGYKRLVLHVGAEKRAFSDAVRKTLSTMRWCGVTSWSDGDHVTVRLDRLNAPGAPTDLAATPDSGTQVTLSWTAPTMDGGSAITGYEYQQSTDGGTTFGAWTAIASSASLTSYAVTGLTANTNYVFKLRAVNAVGEGTESGTAEATTLSGNLAVDSVTIISDPNDDGREGDDDTYAIGDVVTVRVTFGQAVTVTGTPELDLDFEGVAKEAEYASGSGTANLLFEYTVAENDVDADGIAIGTDKLSLPGTATIKAGTTDVPLPHAAVAEDPGHKVEAVRPTLVVTGDDAPKTSIDGFHVILTFSEEIGEVNNDFMGVFTDRIPQAIRDSTMSGTTVDIEMVSLIHSTDTVTVQLGLNSIKDRFGNSIASIQDQSVENNVVEAEFELTVTPFTQTDPDDPATRSATITEGGDTIIVTVDITNGVTFPNDVRFNVRWADQSLTNTNSLEGVEERTSIVIPTGESSGSLTIRAPDWNEVFHAPQTDDLTVVLAANTNVIIGSIPLTLLDDEPVPSVTIQASKTRAGEGEDIELTLTMTPPSGDGAAVLVQQSGAGTPSGAPPTRARFASWERTWTQTVTVPDNTVQNDGARTLTFALQTNPNSPHYTLGDPSAVDVTVVDDDTVSGPPRGFSATPQVHAVRLGWRPPAEEVATKYRVQRDSNAWVELGGDARTYLMEGLSDRQTYTFRIQAGNDHGWSAPVLAKNVQPRPPASPPQAPQHVAAAPGENEVGLSWSAPEDDGGASIERYELRWRQAGAPGPGESAYHELDGSVRRLYGDWVRAGSDPAYVVTGLRGGVAYVFQVRAVNVAGAGEVAETGEVRTLARAHNAPGAPTGLVVRTVHSSRAELAWSAPDETGGSALWGYRVEVCNADCAVASAWRDAVSNTGSTATVWAHAGLGDGALRGRLYRVRAINTGHGAGNPSRPARLSATGVADFRATAAAHRDDAPQEKRAKLQFTVTDPDGRELWARWRDGDDVPQQESLGRMRDAGRIERTITGLEAGAWVEFALDFGAAAEPGLVLARKGVRMHPGPVIATGEDLPPPSSEAVVVELDANRDGAPDVGTPPFAMKTGDSRTYRLRLTGGACEGPRPTRQVQEEWLTAIGTGATKPPNVGLGYAGGLNHAVLECGTGSAPGPWVSVTVTATAVADLPTAAELRHRVLLGDPVEARWVHRVYDCQPDQRMTENTGCGALAERAKGQAKLGVSVTPRTTLGRPNLRVLSAAESARVEWDAVGGATNYEVRWRLGPPGGESGRLIGLLVGGEPSTSWTAAADPSTQVTVRVRAYSNSRVGPWAEAVRPGDPAVPRGLMAIAGEDASIELRWQAPVHDGGAPVAGYRIEVSETGRHGDWDDLAADTGSAAVTYVHTGLAGGDERFYRVSAITLDAAAARRTGPASAIVSGTAGDVLPALSAADATAREGANAELVFAVTRTGPDAGSATVRYATDNGTAIAGEDYVPVSGELAFGPGETEKTVAVAVIDDEVEDSGETLTFTLSDPSGARLERAVATGTIVNTEEEQPLSGFALVDAGTGRTVKTLEAGTEVALSELSARRFAVLAKTLRGASPGSVKIELTGPLTAEATLDAAPWRLQADANGALPSGAWTVRATAYPEAGGAGEALQTLALSFTVTAPALAVTTPGPFTVAEGETAVTRLASPNTGSGIAPVWSIPEGDAGGADAAAFSLAGDGTLALTAAPDFEAPADADGDGIWEVTVQVAEGGTSAQAALEVTVTNVNEAPVADAAADATEVDQGATVTLDGSASHDPDTGDVLSFAWVQSDGSGHGVTLSDASAAQPVFTAPTGLSEDAALVFTLTVTDTGGLSSTDTVAVTVYAQPAVSVEAVLAHVAEGADAVFRLTRKGDIAQELTVAVAVSETGAALGAEVPTSVTFAAGSPTAALLVTTVDDETNEDDSRVTARVAAGTGYRALAEAAEVTVLDDDVAAVAAAAGITLWSATMTVVDYDGGAGGIGAGSADLFSNQGGTAGLQAKWLWYDIPARTLRLAFVDAGLPDVEGMVLHLGAQTVAVPDSARNQSLVLGDVDIAWTDGQTLAVRLVQPSTAELSSDASLASLSLDGAALAPAFDAERLLYRAAVDADTASLTVAAAASDEEAVVAITPEDADLDADGHQVALGYGETLVGVTVVSADGNAKRAYRVVVARARPDATAAEAVTVGVADAQAAEGGALLFVVNLSAAATLTVTVDYATSDGTATAGADYTETSGTLAFPAGGISETISVPVLADEAADDGETVTLTLNNVVHAAFPAGADSISATGTISDGEAEGNGTDEGNALTGFTLVDALTDTDVGTIAAGGTFTLDDPANGSYGIVVDTATGAKIGSVQLALSGALTVTQTENLAPYSLYGDTDGQAHGAGLPAGSYTISATAYAEANLGGATLQTLTAAFTVTASAEDDEAEDTPLPMLSVADASAIEEEDVSLSFAVTLDAASTGTVTVEYATSDGTATAPADYAQTSGTLTFAAGDTSKTVVVTIVDDTAVDSGETLTLTLSNPSGATLADATATGTITDSDLPPLTASFSQVPDEHDGASEFSFHVLFSEAIPTSYTVLRDDDAFKVTGGTVEKARRVNGRDDLREITIEPTGHAAITIELPPTTDCAAKGAICMNADDGRKLSVGDAATVAGPPGLTVADAEGTEADGVVDFTVTLTRASQRRVTVDYATTDDSAHAGHDYEAAEGTLTLAAGTTTATVSVTVLSDNHDDDDERFRLVLSNPSGAWLKDGEAIGTIRNNDPLPKAWLVRFGRSSTDHVLDAITARFDEPVSGSHADLGGLFQLGANIPQGFRTGDRSEFTKTPGLISTPRSIEGTDTFIGRTPGSVVDTGTVTGRLSDPTSEQWSMDGYGSPQGRLGRISMEAPSLGLSDLFLRSSFQTTTRETDGARSLTTWGRAATSRFDGTDDGVAMDGNVATYMLGADARMGRWLTGITLAHSLGMGSFRGDAGTSDLDTVLTALHPYARYELSDRLSLWGVTGFGSGELLLNSPLDETLRTDTSMHMGAAGLRGVLMRSAGGLELAARADARLTDIASAAIQGQSGNLAASVGTTNRLRLLLEGSRRFEFVGNHVFMPRLEIGLRRDGGDAETGSGVEIGGTFAYRHATAGLSVETAARMLLAHADDAYREWGASTSLRFDPGNAGRGLSLSLTPSWGAEATRGAERLWSLHDPRMLATGSTSNTGRRLAADVGYGLPAFRHRGSMTPYAGVQSSAFGRDWRAGVRWRLGTRLDIELEATQRRLTNATEDAFRLRWIWRFEGRSSRKEAGLPIEHRYEALGRTCDALSPPSSDNDVVEPTFSSAQLNRRWCKSTQHSTDGLTEVVDTD